MEYLLDTCALIDAVFAPGRLSKVAGEIIRGDSELEVSIASFWEIMIKQQIGKLGIRETSAPELEAICRELDIEIMQTEVDQIDHIRKLPCFKDHGDPFDRLIICQAMHEGLPVITSDEKFARYDVEVIW